VRQAALIAERVDRPCRHAQERGDFADCQQGSSKRERKTCQIVMPRGIVLPEMSSRCDSLRILATPCDKPTRPFKPRVVGSIPTRLTRSVKLREIADLVGDRFSVLRSGNDGAGLRLRRCDGC